MKPHDFVKKCAGVGLVLIALAGCRAGAPIYDVKDTAIPISANQTLSLNEISSNVSKTIVIDIPSENVFVLNPEVVVNIDIEPLIEHYVTTKIRDIQNTKINIYPSEARIKFTCLQNDFVNSDTALFLPKIDSKQVNRQRIQFAINISPNFMVISDEFSKLI